MTYAHTSTQYSDKSISIDIPLEAGGPAWSDAVEGLRNRLAGDGDSVGSDGRPIPFSPQWARAVQRRLLGVDDCCRDWANSTVLLTPTASTALPGTEQPVPPLTHLRQILGTRSARQSALSRALAVVDRWRAVRVLGPTASGFVAPHVGLYLSESVQREQFAPWVRTHVQNCELATEDAHGEGAVVIEDSPNSTEKTGVVNYLVENVPGCDTRGDRQHGLGGKPEHRWRSAAVIGASDWESVSAGRPAGCR